MILQILMTSQRSILLGLLFKKPQRYQRKIGCF
ncbi:hypothetical protein MXB_58 [Myxobolus squamalis]|nr:hypothetical protein MXB_58 [Myxobolus squamalis]